MPVLVSAYFRARRADGTHPRSAAACAISPDPRRFAGHRRGRDGRRARPHRPSCRKTTTIRGRNELLACFGLAVLAPTAARRSATRRESRESLFREWTTNGNASPAPPSRATTDTTTFRGPGSCASTVVQVLGDSARASMGGLEPGFCGLCASRPPPAPPGRGRGRRNARTHREVPRTSTANGSVSRLGLPAPAPRFEPL